MVLLIFLRKRLDGTALLPSSFPGIMLLALRGRHPNPSLFFLNIFLVHKVPYIFEHSVVFVI